MNRRGFVGAAMATSAAQMMPAWAASRRIKAVAFDGLALFDPRPIFSTAEKMFPDRGAALVASWRTHLFEYTWLRTIMGNYADFLRVAEDALIFAANSEKIALPSDKRQRLMAGFMDMKTWPDVVPVLKRLKSRGLGLAPLNDFTVPMLEAGIKNSDLAGVFDHLLSTDAVRVYKPDPRTYQMAVDAFKLQRDEIAFVAFAGWDAAGAKIFGFPTIWVNRMGMPVEQLGQTPDKIASSFAALSSFVDRRG